MTLTSLLNVHFVDRLSDYEAVGSQLVVPESYMMAPLDSPIDYSAQGQQRNLVWTPAPGVETISHCLPAAHGFPGVTSSISHPGAASHWTDMQGRVMAIFMVSTIVAWELRPPWWH